MEKEYKLNDAFVIYNNRKVENVVVISKSELNIDELNVAFREYINSIPNTIILAGVKYSLTHSYSELNNTMYYKLN